MTLTKTTYRVEMKKDKIKKTILLHRYHKKDKDF